MHRLWFAAVMSLRANLLTLAPIHSLGMDGLSQLRAEGSDLRVPMLTRVFEAPRGSEFLDITGSAIDREGQAIWIKERGEMLVRRIDRRTGRVTAVGRLGDGPLEFRRAASIAPHAKRGVLVFDVVHRRLTHIAADGTPESVLGILDPLFVGNISRLRVDTLGRLFGAEQRVGSEATAADPWGGRPMQLFTDGRVTAVPLALPPLKTSNGWRGSSPEGRSFTWSAAGPSWYHSVLRDGRIASAWTDSGAVWITGLDGAATRISFSLMRDPWTAQQIRSRADHLRTFEATIARERVTMRGPRPRPSATRPELDGLLERMDGGFALARSPLCRNIPAWRSALTRSTAAAGQELCPVLEPFSASGVAEAPIALWKPYTGKLLGMWGDTLWVAMPYPDDADLEGFYRIGEFVVRR